MQERSFMDQPPRQIEVVFYKIYGSQSLNTNVLKRLILLFVAAIADSTRLAVPPIAPNQNGKP